MHRPLPHPGERDGIERDTTPNRGEVLDTHDRDDCRGVELDMFDVKHRSTTLTLVNTPLVVYGGCSKNTELTHKPR